MLERGHVLAIQLDVFVASTTLACLRKEAIYTGADIALVGWKSRSPWLLTSHGANLIMCMTKYLGYVS